MLLKEQSVLFRKGIGKWVAHGLSGSELLGNRAWGTRCIGACGKAWQSDVVFNGHDGVAFYASIVLLAQHLVVFAL